MNINSKLLTLFATTAMLTSCKKTDSDVLRDKAAQVANTVRVHAHNANINPDIATEGTTEFEILEELVEGISEKDRFHDYYLLDGHNDYDAFSDNNTMLKVVAVKEGQTIDTDKKGFCRVPKL